MLLSVCFRLSFVLHFCMRSSSLSRVWLSAPAQCSGRSGNKRFISEWLEVFSKKDKTKKNFRCIVISVICSVFDSVIRQSVIF